MKAIRDYMRKLQAFESLHHSLYRRIGIKYTMSRPVSQNRSFFSPVMQMDIFSSKSLICQSPSNVSSHIIFIHLFYFTVFIRTQVFPATGSATGPMSIDHFSDNEPLPTGQRTSGAKTTSSVSRIDTLVTSSNMDAASGLPAQRQFAFEV